MAGTILSTFFINLYAFLIHSFEVDTTANFYRWINLRLERLNDLFMVTELGSSGAEFKHKRDRVTEPLSVRIRLERNQSPVERGMKSS